MNRKLFMLAGCLMMLGTTVHAQAPVAQFTANVTSGCAPLPVSFQDQSSNNPTAWEWDFGNSQTSSQQNPKVVYATPGTYTVTLIARNASGAGAVRQTDYITVYASPTVSFGVTPMLACAPATVQTQQFSQAGQGSITSYAWTWGDGTTGIGPTPSHVYSQPGYYNVGLTVTNSGGCSNNIVYNRAVRLVNGVQTNFAWSPAGNTCAAPFSLNFLNQTAGPGNMTYNWSFGGGAAPASSTSASPGAITYPSTGSYSVTLIAQSSLGCADTLTQTVPLTANIAGIVGPTSGCVNTPLTFADSASPAPVSVSWDFGDGKPGSNQTTATHTYGTAGTYTVTLTANFPNCSSTTTSTVTIGASLVPSFTGTPLTACQAPLSVQFNDNSPSDNQWTWNFGDLTAPVTGTGTPSHTYSTPGTYTVTLTATNASGCTGTDSISNYVNITAPVINVTGQGACVGQAYTPSFSVTTVDPVAQYSWSAPNASPTSATGASPSFTFASTGLFPVTVTITTNSGCQATQTFNVQVGTPTLASFTYTPGSPICGTSVVSFTSSSAPADQWYWNFGGGNIDSGQSVTYQFKHFGNNQPVILSVSHDGCVTNSTQLISVNPPIPIFGWIVDCANNNPLIANNLVVTFTDSSQTLAAFGPITYDWSFGDGSPDYVNSPPNQIPPPHTYGTAGTYQVILHITNGCTAFAAKVVTVETINASFSISQNPVCNQQTFTLQNTSTTTPFGTPNTGYIWAFEPGDSLRAGSKLQTHLRPPGNYPTTLTVIDQNGCRYTSNPTTINVVAPTASFTSPFGGCDDSTVTFTDNSTPSPGFATAITEYVVNFGDSTGNHSFTSSPFTHQFADTGLYTVIETVVDNGGCSASDTIVNAVQITSPHPLFIEPDSFFCPNTPATFTNLSTGYGLTYLWTFGSIGTSTAQNPTFPFPATNGVTYPVTLTIKDKYGCVMDTTENIKIDSPVAAFTIADTTAICFPLQTMFIASPLYADSLYWEFGDGQTLPLLDTVSHYYNSLDTFTATLVVQGPGGCRDSTSRKVYLTNPATTLFNFTPKTACDSVVAQFTIVPPGYTTFTLQFGDNTSDSSQNPNPVHTYRSPNRFVPLLYLTDATGCIVTRTDSILTVLGAVPFFTATPTAFCDTGTVNFIDYTITNNGILSKAFSFGDGSGPDQQNPPSNSPFNTTYFYSTPGTMLATLKVITLANCTASYTDTIRVYQTPQPIVSDTGNLCQGLVQFRGKLVVPDVDTVFWNWDFGNGQSDTGQNPLVKLVAGTYNIHVTAHVSLGCSDTASGTVTINPNPTIKGPKVITTPVGTPVTIPFTYSPDVSIWNWTPAANLSCTDCANPVATLTFAQTYSVQVADSNNCIDTATILINTVCNAENYFLPNTFSPNGDGVNDYFYPRGTSLYNIQSMTIFNRWGQMVFQRKNFPANSETMGWDGTFNGNPAPPDAYVYIVEVICSNAQVIALHGNVTLIR